MVIKNKKIIYEIDNILLLILLITIIKKEVFIFFYYYFISYFFVIIHEYSHIIVAKIFKIKYNKVFFKIGGMCANIKKNNISNAKYIIIYLAGPLINLILYFIFKNNYYISKINFILFIINLIPIKPLDGYNILIQILNNKLVKIINISSIVILIIVNIYNILHNNNYNLIIILIYVLSLNLSNIVTSAKSK